MAGRRQGVAGLVNRRTVGAWLKPRTSALFTLSLSLSSLTAHADIDAHRLQLAARGDMPWQSLNPEEQRALQRHRGNWDDYDQERQQDMRRGAQRYLDCRRTSAARWNNSAASMKK